MTARPRAKLKPCTNTWYVLWIENFKKLERNYIHFTETPGRNWTDVIMKLLKEKSWFMTCNTESLLVNHRFLSLN